MKCGFCNYESEKLMSLGRHKAWKHKNLSKKEFWVKTLGLEQGICQCGCGGHTEFSMSGGPGYAAYMPGHNLNDGTDPWNKGLTKETNASVRKMSEGVTRTLKRMWKEGHYDNKAKGFMPSNSAWFKDGHDTWNKGTGHGSKYTKDYGIDLKRKVRDGFGNKCARCGKKHLSLDTHHIDTDKENNDLGNFVALCRSCHAVVHTAIAKARVKEDKRLEKAIMARLREMRRSKWLPMKSL